LTTNSVVALIPARGGSERLPGKNVKPLAGKPLIAYTIDAALAASSIDTCIVSTEDPAIADLAQSLGAEVPFMRPLELATPEAKTVDVALHLARFLRDAGRHVDAIAVLQATSPLRTAAHIDEAVAQLFGSCMPSLVSVGPLRYPRTWLRWVVDGRVRKVEGPADVVYRLNGAIYVVRAEALEETGELSPDPCAAYVMERESSLDIDTYDDFNEAERRLAKGGQ